jgi:hypothetical protein
MKEIELTQEQVAIVDDEDYEYLSQWKWHATKHGNTYYAERKPNKKHCIMARIIMKCENDMVVDHINRDGLDNRKENLRICTIAENGRNKTKSKKTTNPYKGIQKNHLKWTAIITYNKFTKCLGNFNSPEEAAIAYDKKARELFGEFANLNFPEAL